MQSCIVQYWSLKVRFIHSRNVFNVEFFFCPQKCNTSNIVKVIGG